MAAEKLLEARTNPASLAHDSLADCDDAAVMSVLEMPEWIVRNEQEWLTRWAEPSSDLVALQVLGSGLRGRMRRSPLMDRRLTWPAWRTCLSPSSSRPVLRRGDLLNAVAAGAMVDSCDRGKSRSGQVTASDMRRW